MGTIFLWLILLAASAALIYLHLTENQRLNEKWRKLFDAENAESLNRFAWNRSWQLFACLGCCIIAIFVYDMQLRSANQTIDQLQDEKDQAVSLLNKETAAATAQAAPAAIAAPIEPQTPSYYPPTVATEKNIGDVYNPEQAATGDTAALDALKKRYEDMLVTYFYLQKCGRVQPDDYHIITSALAQEMASINAPGRLQNDILTAARGSYQEVYATSTCDGANADALAKQYADYIASMAKNYRQ